MKMIKSLSFTVVLLVGLTIAYAADKHTYFKATCPKCGFIQTIDESKVKVTGNHDGKTNGVPALVAERTGSFKCFRCKTKFKSPVKPDQIVPIVVTPSTNK